MTAATMSLKTLPTDRDRQTSTQSIESYRSSLSVSSLSDTVCPKVVQGVIDPDVRTPLAAIMIRPAVLCTGLFVGCDVDLETSQYLKLRGSDWKRERKADKSANNAQHNDPMLDMMPIK